MEASAVPRVAPAGVAALASPGLLRLLSDDRLVALIRDGNANAFEAVYDRHYRAILSFCRHMLGCTDEAEDAVQHTFFAAYNDLISSRKPIRLRAWLFTIARNRCLTILRTRRERTALELEDQATDGLAVQVQRRQDLRDLVIDINRLPEDQRAALVLAEMGALSHDEICTVIGVPKDKVKALIFQARESLLADRTARETDCQEIREQISTMRGAALRRTTIRRHLRSCQACRDYRHDLDRQRRRLALILPVAPTIALRNAVMGVTAGGVTASAGVAGGGLLGASSLLKGAAGKAVIAALIAALGTTGILVVHDIRLVTTPARPLQDHELSTSHMLEASAGQLGAGASRTAMETGAEVRGSDTWNGISVRVLTRSSIPARSGNLLTPVWPHEKLAGVIRSAPVVGGSAPVVAAPSPAASPVAVAPAPVLSSAAAASSPSLGSHSGSILGAPGGQRQGVSGAGSGSGHSDTGGQAPAGLVSPGASLSPIPVASGPQPHSRARGLGPTWPGSGGTQGASGSGAGGSSTSGSSTTQSPGQGAGGGSGGRWGAGGGSAGNTPSSGSSSTTSASSAGSTGSGHGHGRGNRN